jgi:hypothetical protein
MGRANLTVVEGQSQGAHTRVGTMSRRAGTPPGWPPEVCVDVQGPHVKSFQNFQFSRLNLFVMTSGASPTLVSCYLSYIGWWRQKNKYIYNNQFFILVSFKALITLIE